MANNDPSRTEKPTPKRIEEARRKGQVMMSEEVNSLAVVVIGFLLIFPTGRLILSGFGDLYSYCLDRFTSHEPWTPTTILELLAMTSWQSTRIALPFMLGVCAAGALAARVQVGHYLETEALAPKWEQLNPIAGCKQVIPSKDNILKLLLILAKLLVVSGLVYLMLRRELETLVWMPLRGLWAGLTWLESELISLTVTILCLLAGVTVLDYLRRRQQYMDNLMMTKQEVKDEHKNQDGDPQMKGKIRQRMREMTMMRLISEVPNADVVITNPIRVAIALRYQPGDPAPLVVAKGLRKRAARIRAIAREAGVPLIEAPPVARALYRTTEVGGLIPTHLYGAVAAILSRLARFRQDSRRSSRQPTAGGHDR